MTTIKLNSGTDYTPAQLREWLNEKYGAKQTGKPFTNQDVFMYTRRGYLPDKYSGAKITVIKTGSIGIKLLRISKN